MSDIAQLERKIEDLRKEIVAQETRFSNTVDHLTKAAMEAIAVIESLATALETEVLIVNKAQQNIPEPNMGWPVVASPLYEQNDLYRLCEKFISTTPCVDDLFWQRSEATLLAACIAYSYNYKVFNKETNFENVFTTVHDFLSSHTLEELDYAFSLSESLDAQELFALFMSGNRETTLAVMVGLTTKMEKYITNPLPTDDNPSVLFKYEVELEEKQTFDSAAETPNMEFNDIEQSKNGSEEEGNVDRTSLPAGDIEQPFESGEETSDFEEVANEEVIAVLEDDTSVSEGGLEQIGDGKDYDEDFEKNAAFISMAVDKISSKDGVSAVLSDKYAVIAACIRAFGKNELLDKLLDRFGISEDAYKVLNDNAKLALRVEDDKFFVNWVKIQLVS